MSEARDRLHVIHKRIGFIRNICNKNGGVGPALGDEEGSRASIMMHLTSIAEQFDRLSRDGEFEILSCFDKADLKGSYSIRSYIVHDYEGIDLSVIELVIKEKLPKIQKTVEALLSRPI